MTLAALAIVYYAIGIPLMWDYAAKKMRHSHASSDVLMHFIITIMFLFGTTFWILLIPGAMLEKAAANNKK